MGLDYKSSGVDIEAGYRSVELMKEHVKRTMRPEVLGGLGGFSGAFSLEKIKDMEKPVLLSGTDGVGTKLKIAFLMDKHDTVGIGLLHGVIVMSLPKRSLRIAALLENDFRSLFRRVPADVATDEGEHCRDIAAHHTGKGKSVSSHLVG